MNYEKILICLCVCGGNNKYRYLKIKIKRLAQQMLVSSDPYIQYVSTSGQIPAAIIRYCLTSARFTVQCARVGPDVEEAFDKHVVYPGLRGSRPSARPPGNTARGPNVDLIRFFVPEKGEATSSLHSNQSLSDQYIIDNRCQMCFESLHQI